MEQTGNQVTEPYTVYVKEVSIDKEISLGIAVSVEVVAESTVILSSISPGVYLGHRYHRVLYCE